MQLVMKRIEYHVYVTRCFEILSYKGTVLQHSKYTSDLEND